MEKKRILMLGNDPAFYKWIQSCLQDYDIDLFYTLDSQRAHYYGDQNEYCLIIIDLQTTDVKMLRILRSMVCFPILVFSEELSSTNQAALLRAGADVCLQKTIDIDVCAAQVQSMSRFFESTGKKNTGGFIVSGRLIINQRQRKVFVDGRAVLLTRKEFDMLLFFAKHPEQVFSTNQLYKQIWNDDSVISGKDTVKAHIKRLRRKLVQVGKDCIQNVWGVGYRFTFSTIENRFEE